MGRDRFLLDQFYFDRRAKNRTPKTLKQYVDRLRYLIDLAVKLNKPLTHLTKHDIQEYVYNLLGSVSDATVNGRIRAFSAFYNYLAQDWPDDLPENPMERIGTVGERHKVKRVLSVQQVVTILNSFPKESFEGHRNRMMVRLMYDCFLRMNEARQLRVSNVDLEARLIKVEGKGRRERLVPMSSSTLRAMHRYLTRWRKGIPGDLLLCDREGAILAEPSIYSIFRRISIKVGFKVHAHLLRHSAITEYLSKGGSGFILQRIVGHSAPFITSQYFHPGSDQVKDEHEKYAVGADLPI